MAQIITNPEGMQRFANELKEFSRSLRKEELALFGELANLGATWKDPQFQQFDRKITETAKQLATFHQKAEKYASFLDAKAQAGRKILRR